ncbi:DUF429 domain-containing protein [Aeropyrum camini]|uniref:DUF429 domain-containing protein n=1 Tax=Aeropyrum camini TaxID=229980 RepID=UPI000788DBE9|nr:DUF429 domain-containing protein [Aeropyrum camini]
MSDFGTDPPAGGMGSRVRADERIASGKLYVGVDPSGGKGSWGFAVVLWLSGGCRILRAWESKPSEAYSSLKRLAGAGVYAVGVDAPLNILGRTPTWRGCERYALKRGARLLPLNTPGMIALSRIGNSIFRLLEEAGIPAVEAHPSSILSALGLKPGTIGEVML